MRACLYFVLAILLTSLPLEKGWGDSPPSISPLSLADWSEQELVLSWQLSSYDTLHQKIDGETYVRVNIPASAYPEEPGHPNLPKSLFTLGVPENGSVRISVEGQRFEVLQNSVPVPVATPGRNENGQVIYRYVPEPSAYTRYPRQLIVQSDTHFLRDLPVREIAFHPVSYDGSTRSIRITTAARIIVTFDGEPASRSGFFPRGRLDRLLSERVVNFEQAQGWIRPRPRTLGKIPQIGDGPWYRITVAEDGLYKIPRASLSSAGIDVTSLDPRTIRIYNSGGAMLDVAAPENGLNPRTLVENAVMVTGEDDGVFNEGDYILFYGTQPGGWNYSGTANDFIYIQHPYDKENEYWLSYGGELGKRMQVTDPPTGTPAVEETFFMARDHFEEERYNLLASGLNWYGHRFFGISGNASFSYDLDYRTGSNFPAKFRIKLKSGNAIRYDDPPKYEYAFTISLNTGINSTPLFVRERLGSRGSRILEKSFTASSYLTNGSNNLAVDYIANLQDCSAYVDWVEFYYPHDLNAEDNHLLFYTNTVGQTVRFRISGLTRNDVQVWDITEPTAVRRIGTAQGVQNGTLVADLDLRDSQHRRFIAASPNSGKVKTVSSLRRYTPKQNLLDPGLAAELIVITHPSFESYSRELVEMRESAADPVTGRVVTTDDIYFYFSSGVTDPVAIRNFIRYAYDNWSNPQPSYVLLFGDGHYDYRNISLPDTNRVPPYEIEANDELNSRESDNFYVDVNHNSPSLSSISPDLAIGRMPAESHLDARRMMDKLKTYEDQPVRDGWQITQTFVADDEVTARTDNEWIHQNQTETLATLQQLEKFLIRKIYLSAYNSVPGGFGRVKPEANQAIIDQLNEGTLLINYVGHGSPQEWAHENVLNMTRDLNRIQNQGKLTFWIAATCDFGKYDDPTDPSFSEALVWQPDAGAIAVVSAARLVYSGDNFRFNRDFMRNLFPNGRPSRRLGDAMWLASFSGINDQKYHLFGDPSMYLADPRDNVVITSISPDSLKALSRVKVEGYIGDPVNGELNTSYEGGAVLIANDAGYDSVNTGGPGYYEILGARIFKGEISVESGIFSGEFVVPKSIRYADVASGRVTIYAWNEEGYGEALGYVDTLLFNGTEGNLGDDDGPDIDIYFEDQETFRDGDLIPSPAKLIATVGDENGINLTGEVGHTIDIAINDQRALNITPFFSYDRNSFTEGRLTYNLEQIEPGEHTLTLKAWDNLNNPGRKSIRFRVAEETGLVLADVVNYPNPFGSETNFTFQAQGVSGAAEVTIKIYTVSGRLIRTMDLLGRPVPGFNYYPWDGRDADGDILANGVYLYKIILRDGDQQREVIEKLVVLR